MLVRTFKSTYSWTEELPVNKNGFYSNNQQHWLCASVIYYYHILQINATQAPEYFISSLFLNRLWFNFVNLLFFSGLTRGLVIASAWVAWLCHRDQFYSQGFSFLISCSDTFSSTDLLKTLCKFWLILCKVSRLKQLEQTTNLSKKI